MDAATAFACAAACSCGLNEPVLRAVPLLMWFRANAGAAAGVAWLPLLPHTIDAMSWSKSKSKSKSEKSMSSGMKLMSDNDWLRFSLDSYARRCRCGQAAGGRRRRQCDKVVVSKDQQSYQAQKVPAGGATTKPRQHAKVTK